MSAVAGAQTALDPPIRLRDRWLGLGCIAAADVLVYGALYLIWRAIA